MTTETKFYVGIDVSKDWFDASVIPVKNYHKLEMVSSQFESSKNGLLEFRKWLNLLPEYDDRNLIIVIENTGIYHRLIWDYCTKEKLFLHIGNAAHIRWSLGIIRGKNDTVDSKRIATYCMKNAEGLNPTPAMDSVILQLKDLFALRTKANNNRNRHLVTLDALKSSKSKEDFKELKKLAEPAMLAEKKTAQLVEKKMTEIIKNNPALKHTYDLIITVPGIGKITALYLICCTNNFSRKITGKQLSSYAGVVPYGYSSGKSVRGKNKVHPMANKKLKSILYMGAMSLIQHKEEFRVYYHRKIAEGKNPIAVINAIKNKMLIRVAAVVNNQTPYVTNYQYLTEK